MTTSTLSPEAIFVIIVMGFIIASMMRPRSPTMIIMQPPIPPAEGSGCLTTLVIACVFILSIILLASIT